MLKRMAKNRTSILRRFEEEVLGWHATSVLNICYACKKEKYQFVLKLITSYFLYGYLCFLGILILLFVGYHTYRLFSFPKNLFSIFFIICSLPLLGQFLRIVFFIKYRKIRSLYLYSTLKRETSERKLNLLDIL